MAAVLLLVAACGTAGGNERPEPSPQATATPSALMGLEEFCGDYGEQHLLAPLEELMSTFDAFTDSLADLTPADREELQAGIGELEGASAALADTYLEAAARVEDQDLAADIERFVDQVETLVAFTQEAILQGDLGESNPADPFTEAFMSMARHCEGVEPPGED